MSVQQQTKIKARVIKILGNQILVRTKEGEEHSVLIRGKFRAEYNYYTSPVAVGDYVVCIKSSETFLINEIEKRNNFLERKSVNLSKQSHLLAANIDLTVLVITIKCPKTYSEFIDRFLLNSELSNIEALLVFNKIDILNNQEKEHLRYQKMMYESVGYKCITTSVLENNGIGELKKKIANKLIYVMGNSGVGKTSLINKINPRLDLKVSSVSKTRHLGTHTTSHTEMYHFFENTWIIDSPGIKSLGLRDIDKNLISFGFREFREFSKTCKFNNCMHIYEPECSVKKALKKGKISERRYVNYKKIVEDITAENLNTYRKKEY